MKRIPLIILIFPFFFLTNCFGVESSESLIKKIYSSEGSSAESTSLSYYSDYFSFVGRDSKGWVAFALDNNRGQDGKGFQAEHFVVLHDEHQGWIRVRGNGSYPNPNQELKSIPNSKAFQFKGNPEQGITIERPANQINLSLKPVNYQLENKRGLAHLRMGSAPAILHWGGRTIQGRVIYEYIFLPEFNRLSRSYSGLWKDFHGIYLSVEGGGDFYYHSQQSDLLKPLVGEVAGFFYLPQKPTELISKLNIKATDFEQAKGSYKWPTSWQGSFLRGQDTYNFKGNLSKLNTISNWVTGGFAMGILTGEITKNKRTYTVYGLGELLI
jgi:hypothetical protein